MATNMEIENAKEWNDTTTLTSQASEPEHPLAEPDRRSLQNRVPRFGHIQDVDHKLASRPAPTRSNSRGVSSAGVHGQTKHDVYNDRQARKQATGVRAVEKKKVPWGKTKLVSEGQSMKALQDRTRDNKEKVFLGEPDDESTLFAAIAYFAWPYTCDNDQGPTTILGSGLATLNPVRTKFFTFIDWIENLKCLRLRTWCEGNIEEALTAVAMIARHQYAAHGHENQNHKAHLVEPPSPLAWRSEVHPVFGVNVIGPMVPVTRAILSGQPLKNSDIAEWSEQVTKIKEAHRKKLDESLRDILDRLQPLRCGMKLRVHFGHVHLTRYKKDFKEARYSYYDFAKMLRGSRIESTFEKQLGNAGTAATVFNGIIDMGEYLFEPADWKVLDLNDVGEQHQLVLFARAHGGASSPLVRVEASIDNLSGGSYQAGSTNYFKHENQVRRLDLQIINLESKLDWCMQLATTDEIAEPPKPLEDYIQESLARTHGLRNDEQGFTYPNMRLRQPNGFEIGDVLIRSTRSYGIKSTPEYVLEATVNRHWRSFDTSCEPTITFGLCMGSKAWDEDLRARSNIGEDRKWYSELKGLFDTEGGENSSISDLMTHVAGVRSFLDELNEFD